MTFRDWVRDSAARYREQPPQHATARSAAAFARGILRRLPWQVVPTIWDRGDWDVVVILDACRVDLLADVADEYDCLPADITSVWSPAACSIDWIERTFNDHPAECEGVAYVTANPFADHDAPHAKSADLREHPRLTHLRKLYTTEWAEIDAEGDGGSGTIETVPPERVTDHAIDCWRRRDELGVERLVVHYMQPHEPYLTRPEWSQLDTDNQAVLKNLVEDGYTAGMSPWEVMRESDTSVAEFWQVYLDNLRWVLDDVSKRLLPNLDGQVVVSADHGNGLGEYGDWHHPPGAISPYVRKVPWVEVTCTDQRTVTPQVNKNTPQRETKGQLEALGYR